MEADDALPHKAFPDGEFTDAELKALGHCNALTNQEAKIVLKRFTESNMKLNKLWQPPPLAQKAIDYLDKVEAKTELSHQDTVQKLREEVQAEQVYEYEMALLANLTPETAEEAMALVKSLQARYQDREADLQSILDRILTLKSLQ